MTYLHNRCIQYISTLRRHSNNENNFGACNFFLLYVMANENRFYYYNIKPRVPGF